MAMITIEEELRHGSTIHHAEVEFDENTPAEKIVDTMAENSPYKYTLTPNTRAELVECYERDGWFGHGWSWFVRADRREAFQAHF